ncbi:MAG TPA: pyridoxamine 5'-phosphate oxidase family protein [Rugosimonospora sp.]|nr:pyridoxamine 5'-phosphate oxidase family protein [Rugosimonospora sp.]
MVDTRSLLEAYVRNGKVMQLATLDGKGAPYVSNLWFASSFGPDRLWFISRPTRMHSENIRERPAVAGAVLAIDLDELGQAVRGVTFSGTAKELPTTNVETAIGAYVGRWPNAAHALDSDRLANGAAHHRIYEIAVNNWILYDEENFSAAPRQPVAVC